MFAFVVLFQVGSGDDCVSSPCQNGGACTDIIAGSYTCTCGIEYTGDNCEIDIDDCALGPCLNGGTCTDEAGSYTCSCVAGYYGENCGSDPLDVCKWSVIAGNDIGAGTYFVPADGCRMKKYIMVKVDVTIEGVSGSFRELQSNRVDHQDVAASPSHRHFHLYSPGKLTLNYLKLTWGQTSSSSGYKNGGFIYMNSGTLDINWVYFNGSETTGTHAYRGGCIAVMDGKVTIKESTFEGFRASSSGGAMFVFETSTPMMIESTRFIDNEADVRFIYYIFYVFFYFEYFFYFFLIFFVHQLI